MIEEDYRTAVAWAQANKVWLARRARARDPDVERLLRLHRLMLSNPGETTAARFIAAVDRFRVRAEVCGQ